MIDEEEARAALDDEPTFVRRDDRARSVEFLDVECTSLRPRGSFRNLSRNGVSLEIWE